MAEIRDIIFFSGKHGEQLKGVVVGKRFVNARKHLSHYVLTVAQFNEDGTFRTNAFWTVHEINAFPIRGRVSQEEFDRAMCMVREVREKREENHEAVAEGGLHLIELLDIRSGDRIEIKGRNQGNWTARVIEVRPFKGRVGIAQIGVRGNTRWIPAQAIARNLSQIERQQQAANRLAALGNTEQSG